MQITVSHKDRPELYYLDVEPSATVGMVLDALAEAGLAPARDDPLRRRILSRNGKTLPEGVTLGALGITDGEVLELVVETGGA